MRSFEEQLFSDPPSEADAEAERARALREYSKDRFLQTALEDEAGRLWFWDQLVRCHLFANSFVPGAPDSTAFALGERNIGLQILADIMRVSPRAYLLMTEENPA